MPVVVKQKGGGGAILEILMAENRECKNLSYFDDGFVVKSMEICFAHASY